MFVVTHIREQYIFRPQRWANCVYLCKHFFVLEGWLVVAIYVMSVWPAIIDRATAACPAVTATTMTIVYVAEVSV